MKGNRIQTSNKSGSQNYIQFHMFRKMTEHADVDNSIMLLQEQLDLMVRRSSESNVEEFPMNSVISGPEGQYN